jgi:hypothetical protein
MSERVSLSVAGQRLGVSGGDIRRIATAGERAGVLRAAALARAGLVNAAGEPES